MGRLEHLTDPKEELLLRASRARDFYPDVLIFCGSKDGKTAVTVEVKRDEGLNQHRVYEPQFNLSDTAAQTLMDDLWYAGIRPSQHFWRPDAGTEVAMAKHLDDMRKIVEAKLKVKLI